MPVVGGGAAMVGHAWPLFARFRGGRSVATFGGAAGVISPVTTAAAISAGVVAGRVTGSAARGIQAGFVAYPVVQLAVDGPRRTAATGVLDVVHRPALLDGRSRIRSVDRCTAALAFSSQSTIAVSCSSS